MKNTAGLAAAAALLSVSLAFAESGCVFDQSGLAVPLADTTVTACLDSAGTEAFAQTSRSLRRKVRSARRGCRALSKPGGRTRQQGSCSFNGEGVAQNLIDAGSLSRCARRRLRRTLQAEQSALAALAAGAAAGCGPAPEPTPICRDGCGDGVCAEVVCLGTGCPCGESPESCPADCGGSPD